MALVGLLNLDMTAAKKPKADKVAPDTGTEERAAPDSDNPFEGLPVEGYDADRIRDDILAHIKVESTDYDHWLDVGKALHHQFGGAEEGLALWDEWSAADKREPPAGYPGEDVLAEKYAGLGDYDGKRLTLRTLLERTKDARRAAQREANRVMGEEGLPINLLVERMTADEMQEHFVYIAVGDRVGDLRNPRRVMTRADLGNLYAASKAAVGENGEVTKATSLWFGRAGRKTVQELTWLPDAGPITHDPDGTPAFNSFQPFPTPVFNYRPDLAEHFVNHIRILFGDRADDVLDWMAHIEQKPGELPHTAWLHIATKLGVGRNWIASVLCKVWFGGVAGSFDLVGFFNSGFNGTLSRKVLAVVDEIREGGTDSSKHAQKLKSIITEATRVINPKYGRQSTEYNCCRWLLFSNHRSAIPLGEGDRRFEVVIYDGEPQSPDYYIKLYGLLRSNDFIHSVRRFLAERDISAFNPGAKAKMTVAKQQLVVASRSDLQNDLHDLMDNYEWPLITMDIVRHALGMNSEDAARRGAALKYAMEDAGWVRLKEYKYPWLRANKQVVYVRADQFSAWTGSKLIGDGLPDQKNHQRLTQIASFGGD
jgi:hypothetical protein